MGQNGELNCTTKLSELAIPNHTCNMTHPRFFSETIFSWRRNVSKIVKLFFATWNFFFIWELIYEEFSINSDKCFIIQVSYITCQLTAVYELFLLLNIGLNVYILLQFISTRNLMK